MGKKKKQLGVAFEERQMDFIKRFADKRGISKSEAVRIIVEVRRKQEQERGD